MSTISAPHEPNAAGLPARDVRVAIVGAGFGGLGTAIRLREQGIDDFVILERADRLGGTWWANTYPGCACDVPSHLYSYSFALNPDWTRFFAPQHEILAYLERTARERGVTDHIVYGAEVLNAQWDADAGRWRLDTAAGPVTAQALIAAAGPLSEPSVPDIPGLGDYKGTLFHSARWDHEHDLTGERVAVIGTGASAAQFVPYVARDAAHLDVYQRTPGWILPRGDRAVPPLERRLFRRLPVLQRALRNLIYYVAELLVVGLTIDQRVLSVFEAVARRKLRRSVPDPELRAKLTPTYRIGCKRIIFSDDYLPALARSDVGLVTDRIEAIDATGIRTVDGRHRPVDTIILGTGFEAWASPMSERLVGAEGQTLAAVWAQSGGPQAYVGTAIAGFPNLFFLIGPNTGLGNNSMINIIEGQLVYVLEALRTMDRMGAESIEVHPSVQDRYNAQIQRQMEGTVWTEGGCRSWYLSEDGTNRALWPSFSDAFKRRLARFDLADFQVTQATLSRDSPAVQAGASDSSPHD